MNDRKSTRFFRKLLGWRGVILLVVLVISILLYQRVHAVMSLRAKGFRVTCSTPVPDAVYAWTGRECWDALGRTGLVGNTHIYIPSGNKPVSVAPEELDCLRHLQPIEWLSLDRTGATDEHVAHLRGLKELKCLNLSHTALTDECLPDIQSLTSLEMLFLMGTSVSDDGVARLREALPSCCVFDAQGVPMRPLQRD